MVRDYFVSASTLLFMLGGTLVPCHVSSRNWCCGPDSLRFSDHHLAGCKKAGLTQLGPYGILLFM